ncbi:MAG TPA: aminotransferase class V-fold PLP-dependent enzyme [Acidimicrobiales bacterium]|nr:aminotransferase class V-fold PLP-dependent enzyme [Acidimicrobiales bacterium]
MSRHYLDHASTSPLRPEARRAMLEALDGPAGDPSRVHEEARVVRAALEDARQSVAALAGVGPGQVVFTSGATEAINAAVWGAARRQPGAILCAGVEHSAVREASARLAPVVEIEVDGKGRISAGAVESAGRRAIDYHGAVSLIHCQWANHEVGTLQPVGEVTEAAHRLGALVHVDAAAALGHHPQPVGELGADLVSISSHKLGGPAGAGALLVRRGLRLEPFLVGGSQERARRAGLENLAALAGFGAAAAHLSADGVLDAESARAREQTERVTELCRALAEVDRYGDPDQRVAHIICVGVRGVEAEAVVIGLDQAGVAVHSGSACSSEVLEPSAVLAAMGVDADRSIRVSVGWSTTAEDITALEDALPDVVARLRRLGREA